MSGCELEQEGFCTHESEEYGVTIKPRSCKYEGPNGECTAKPKDLVTICPHCLKPYCHNEDCLVDAVLIQSQENQKEPTK